jgi:hypothetical protein
MSEEKAVSLDVSALDTGQLSKTDLGKYLKALGSELQQLKKAVQSKEKNELKIDGVVIDRDLMIKMLKRENELRLSNEVQSVYSELEDRYDMDWMEYTIQVQEKVVKEFGFDKSPESTQLAVNTLRRAQYLYPDDPEVLSIPLYVKYNRAKRGYLQVGDHAPDVMLAELNGNHKPLSSFFDETKPLVLVSGSYT